MPSINTLHGPLDTSEIGQTLIHEHVVIRTPGVRENWPDLYDENAAVESARVRFAAVRERGIGTITDLTTADMGRDIQFLSRVAEVTDLNIVVTSGDLLDCAPLLVEPGFGHVGRTFRPRHHRRDTGDQRQGRHHQTGQRRSSRRG